MHERDCLCPLDVIGQLVDEHDIDVLLIAGDLFDHARVSDVLVISTFAKLAKIGCEVVLLPGNHDVHDSTAVYARHRAAIEHSGVRFFDTVGGNTHDVANGALRIWSRCMEEHTPEFVPLAGPPSHPSDRWFVVAGHGHFAPDNSESHRSSRITVQDLDMAGADYVALGHWHVTTDLRTRGSTALAWYSGAPLFGHGAGNVLLVDFVEGEPVRVQTVGILDHPAAFCIQ